MKVVSGLGAKSARSVAPLALLIDTNILLDIILAREPHALHSTHVFDAIANGRALGFVAGHSITTVHYITESQTRNRQRAVNAVADILSVLTVVELNGADFQRALTLDLKDFEDAVQAVACLKSGADLLVTRNVRDYRGAPVHTVTPGEAIAAIATRHPPESASKRNRQ